MGVPVRQMLTVAGYLLRQKLAGRAKFPLIVELEPLFACNLACAGCGKIQHPHAVLKRRMSVEDAVRGIEDCGAPMVSIAGGEPLIHPQIHEIVRELVARKKFVYLCTNGLLLRRKLDLFAPSAYFSWAVHMDGLRERHDAAVCEDGVFDECVLGIRAAKQRGFRVTTNTTFFTTDSPSTVRQVLDFLNDELRVDQTRKLFSEAFAGGRRRRWRLNHSPLFLDFLEGKADFDCTAWAIPSFSTLGWQRPCYLMSDGYAGSYRELIETTEWEKYGRGRDPRCANCMAHCGYEPTAVLATTRSLKQSLRAFVASI